VGGEVANSQFFHRKTCDPNGLRQRGEFATWRISVANSLYWVATWREVSFLAKRKQMRQPADEC
jgi:hypothetical protein